MLIDTDIIIWYMRGNELAREFLEANPRFRLSVVTYMELVQGMRNKNELRALRRALKNWKAEILYINEEISSKAMFYVEQHYLSHSVQLADALIAATAVSYGLPIATGNIKHYKVLKDAELVQFRPA
ncbi:MAG: type II toxin-antitoxin system VapC family toxin [Anaerolineales bacterium]|nr:type II toxin-antitoxin system VapC family toxin [Anaerolineales bacterium]MCB8940136.1 type II toxin-antitoxin system VapC family toxin [Ardenticatenaceae bacterium]